MNNKLILPKQKRSKKTVYMVLAVFVALVVAFFIFNKTSSKQFQVSNSGNATGSPTPSVSQNASPFSGESCANYNMRSVAVMVSEDPQARPLSGIQDASIVFEMPVTPDGINRLMAVYQCNLPSAIGSIRSARMDYVPLAMGLDSILAHWGGEENVLSELNKHIIDNIDALVNPSNAFYRTNNAVAPENGFTSGDNLEKAIKSLGYRNTNNFGGYSFLSSSGTQPSSGSVSSIKVAYPEGYDVEYQYDQSSNSYGRSRGGTPEVDKLTGNQVSVKNIIIMQTTVSPWYSQYIRVNVLGSGNMRLFRDGTEIDGTWQKNTEDSQLYFFDQSGKQIQLEPGNTWVEITDKNTQIKTN